MLHNLEQNITLVLVTYIGLT
uniref:Uncharacterized protein n=1 Tax=Rhizophora mucronata TaxID=61149 RepID=A0A2P2PZD7_RHIMU